MKPVSPRRFNLLGVATLVLAATSVRCGALNVLGYSDALSLCEVGKTLSVTRGRSQSYLEIVPVGLSPMTFRCSRVVYYDGDRVTSECLRMGPIIRIVSGVVAAVEIYAGSLFIAGRRADKIVLDSLVGSILLADGVLAAALVVFLKTKRVPTESRRRVAVNRFPDVCPSDLIIEVDERKIPVSPLGQIDPADETWLADHLIIRGGSFRFRFDTTVVVVQPSPKERCAWAKMYLPITKREAVCGERPVAETPTPKPSSPAVPIPAALLNIGTIHAIIPIPLPLVVPPAPKHAPKPKSP